MKLAYVLIPGRPVRDDFTARTALLFAVLLVLKMAHWLAQDRVDFVRHVGLFRNISARSLLILISSTPAVVYWNLEDS